jgi:hypothetical protein
MRIKIWAPSNLLSVVLDREISEAQAALVRATLEATDLVSEAELATLLDAVHAGGKREAERRLATS